MALAPTSKLFGLDNDGWYNLQIARYVALLLLPYFLIQLFYNRNILVYSKKIILHIVILIFSIVLATLLREGEIDRTYLLNIEIFLVVLIYSLLVFHKFPDDADIIVRRFLSIVIVFSGLLSLSTYFFIEPFYTVQKLFYNTYIGLSGLESLFDFAEINSRSYSIFSAANQFSLLASFSIIFSYYFLKNFSMNKINFFIIFIFSLIILLSSGSRTGMVFYCFTLLMIYKEIKFNKKVFLLPLIPIFILFVIGTLPDRILDTFTNFDTVIDDLGGQRIIFWLVSWNFLNEDISNVLFGFREKMFILNEGAHFESGFLQLWGTGGILGLLIFVSLLKSIYDLRLRYEERILKFIILLFILSEFFMGVFFELKWSVLNGVFVAFLIQKSYLNHCNPFLASNNKNKCNKKVVG